jgi:uncharacterized protein (UPF0276 family)
MNVGRVKRSPSFGVGLDMPWGRAPGFVTAADRRDVASADVAAFVDGHADVFDHVFLSWQPKDRSRLDARAFFDAYDDFFARAAPRYRTRALHHTALNLGALEPYDRSELYALTNALIERYRFEWVNEDLGIWSLRGKPLPYPLPPYLCDDGLKAAVKNVSEAMSALAAPLLVEFPGFAEGTSLIFGDWHAYDFFDALAEETGALVTLDTGHLLSYQWLRGARGDALLDDIERLPLDRCFEIHLSGCAVRESRFYDLHDGTLLPEQLALLDRLLESCPNVRAVTYEDPRFLADGTLRPENADSLRQLVERAQAWGRA